MYADVKQCKTDIQKVSILVHNRRINIFDALASMFSDTTKLP